MRSVILRVVFIAATYVGYLFMGYAVDRGNFLEVLLGYSFYLLQPLFFTSTVKNLLGVI